MFALSRGAGLQRQHVLVLRRPKRRSRDAVSPAPSRRAERLRRLVDLEAEDTWHIDASDGIRHLVLEGHEEEVCKCPAEVRAVRHS
eukprot:scaffold4278_cov263-Pinguiococcus_pyrenoidosus.AAC.11